MWWILIIVTVFILVHIAIKINENKTRKERLQQYKSEGKIYVTNFDTFYMGGLKDISACPSLIEVFDNKITMKFIINFDTYNREFNLKDILDVKIQSDIQIQNQISLGKMVFFGAFALASPNQKTVINEYIVMTVLYQGEKLNLIFKLNAKTNMEFIKVINEVKDNHLKDKN